RSLEPLAQARLALIHVEDQGLVGIGVGELDPVEESLLRYGPKAVLRLLVEDMLLIATLLGAMKAPGEAAEGGDGHRPAPTRGPDSAFLDRDFAVAEGRQQALLTEGERRPETGHGDQGQQAVGQIIHEHRAARPN